MDTRLVLEYFASACSVRQVNSEQGALIPAPGAATPNTPKIISVELYVIFSNICCKEVAFSKMSCAVVSVHIPGLRLFERPPSKFLLPGTA